MDELIPTPSWLSDWGFSLASEASHEPKEYKPVDCTRDLQQARELIETSGGTISPGMLLAHPFIKLSPEARKYLEGFENPPSGKERSNERS